MIGAMHNIDDDRPVEHLEADEYGFAPIAEKLAKSIAGLAESDGMVFGIEGPWGSGKTSFLNFLRMQLNAVGGVHVLNLAPWLLGDSRSLVASLADAIGPLLESAEKDTGKRVWFNRRDKALKSVDLIRAYAARTGRGVAPFAKLAGLFLPGGSAVGEAMELGAKALGGLGGGQSDEALKAEISQRIIESGLRFVVLVDDLDRLEPAQAVEVMRLIRSVADFPHIAYVLCYDREVVSHALETGLSLKDGDLYLQKIVQLTFALPLPEPFDLRNALRRRCLDLYRMVQNHDLQGEELGDLTLAIDREGSALRTPRDVKLVLNGLAFVYPSVAEEVHFPDLCRIHLLKVLHPKLHRWVERYLAERAVLSSGDARVSKAERVRFGTELFELLPDEDSDSASSIWSLRRFIPGVRYANEPEGRVFQETSRNEVSEKIRRRAVGSPLHHRFYFALSAPKAVISPRQMVEIRRAAAENDEAIEAILDGYIRAEHPHGQSWYEHLITRLDDGELEGWSFEELAGLVMGFATTYRAAKLKLENRQAFTLSLSDKIQNLTNRIIRRMRGLDASKVPSLLGLMYRKGELSWLVGHFHRDQLWTNGVVGDRSKPQDQWVLTDEDLEAGGKVLEERIEQASKNLASVADFSSLIWGWRDLSGADSIKRWIEQFASDDRGLLSFLMSLRSWAVSDHVYYPLRRSAIEIFFDYEEVLGRMDAIYAAGDGELAAEVEELRESIRQGADRD